jgi:hypothetical protein
MKAYLQALISSNAIVAIGGQPKVEFHRSRSLPPSQLYGYVVEQENFFQLIELKKRGGMGYNEGRGAGREVKQ